MKIKALMLIFVFAMACGDSESESSNNENNQNNMIDPADVEWTLTTMDGDVFMGEFASKQQRANDLGISMSGEAGTLLFTIPAQLGQPGTYPVNTVQIGLVDAYDNCGWAIVNEDDVAPASVTLTTVEGTRQLGTFTITGLECDDPAGKILNASGDFIAR